MNRYLLLSMHLLGPLVVIGLAYLARGIQV